MGMALTLAVCLFVLLGAIVLVSSGIEWRPMRGRATVLCSCGLVLLFVPWLLSLSSPERVEAVYELFGPQSLIAMGLGVMILTVGVALLKGEADAAPHTFPHAEILTESLEKVAQSERVVESVMHSAVGGAFILRCVPDRTGETIEFRFERCNRALEQILGTSREALIGASPSRLRRHDVGHWLLEQASTVVATGLPIRVERSFENDQRTQWLEVAIASAGRLVTGAIVDTTSRKGAEIEQWRAARTDPLTGLPNRKSLLERVEAEAHRARSMRGYSYALFFLDFDGFKRVNDTLGHEAGDELLRSIAGRLARGLDEAAHRATEAAPFVARLGGDEFVALLPSLRDASCAVPIAQSLVELLAAPHDLAGRAVQSTASVGVAIDDGSFGSAAAVLSAADEAMYAAKRSGKNRLSVAPSLSQSPDAPAGVDAGRRSTDVGAAAPSDQPPARLSA